MGALKSNKVKIANVVNDQGRPQCTADCPSGRFE